MATRTAVASTSKTQVRGTVGEKGGAKASTSAAASRGKRKLDFEGQRFRGKLMFLDIAGYRRAEELERQLLERGATIEKRFHEGVRYLVTIRPTYKAQSPSTPSPLTPGTARSATSQTQIISPNTDSPYGIETRQRQPPQTRAQKMVQLSKEKQKSAPKPKLDLVAMANTWKCKVVYLDELLTELKKLKPLPNKEGQELTRRKDTKVRVLEAPFFKVEDSSCSYRPLVYEASRWPAPNPHCSPKGCPFESPKHANTVCEQGGGRERRAGYCECCAVRYKDLHMHLKSARHVEYATNSANFASLDSLIAKGTSFEDFITGVRTRSQRARENASSRSNISKCFSPAKVSGRKHRSNAASEFLQEPQDSIALVTPPSSPVTDNKSPQRHSPSQDPKAPRGAVRESPVPRGAVRESPVPRGAVRESPVLRGAVRESPVAAEPSQSPARLIVLPRDVVHRVLSPPKHGELRITPVARLEVHIDTPDSQGTVPTGREYTPGFTTPTAADATPPPPPPSVVWMAAGTNCSRIDEIAMKLRRRAQEKTVTSAKRLLPPSPTAATPPPRKRISVSLERISPCQVVSPKASSSTPEGPNLVPETPQKKSALRPDSTLCNLCSLTATLKACGISHSQDLNMSPVFRPQASKSATVRKSPRLLEREYEKTRAKVTTRTEATVRFPTTQDGSLTVSIQLNKITLRGKTTVDLGHTLSPASPLLGWIGREVSLPSGKQGTPEIALQGVPPNGFLESPLFGIVRLPPSLNELIGGYSEDPIGCNFVGFSPMSVAGTMPEFVAGQEGMLTRSKVREEGGTKRPFDSSGGSSSAPPQKKHCFDMSPLPADGRRLGERVK